MLQALEFQGQAFYVRLDGENFKVYAWLQRFEETAFEWVLVTTEDMYSNAVWFVEHWLGTAKDWLFTQSFMIVRCMVTGKKWLEFKDHPGRFELWPRERIASG